MLKKFLFAIVVLFAILKANALNYKVTNVNRIEFGNGNGLSIRFHPKERSTVVAEITYCVYNQKQEVVNCHFKDRNDFYLRIKITHPEFKVNNFKNGDVITSFKLYHEARLGGGGNQINDSIIAFGTVIAQIGNYAYYIIEGPSISVFYNRFEFRTSSGKTVRLVYEHATVERK